MSSSVHRLSYLLTIILDGEGEPVALPAFGFGGIFSVVRPRSSRQTDRTDSFESLAIDVADSAPQSSLNDDAIISPEPPLDSSVALQSSTMQKPKLPPPILIQPDTPDLTFCLQCEFVFVNVAALLQHFTTKKHKWTWCPDCRTNFSPSNLRKNPHRHESPVTDKTPITQFGVRPPSGTVWVKKGKIHCHYFTHSRLRAWRRGRKRAHTVRSLGFWRQLAYRQFSGMPIPIRMTILTDNAVRRNR